MKNARRLPRLLAAAGLMIPLAIRAARGDGLSYTFEGGGIAMDATPTDAGYLYAFQAVNFSMPLFNPSAGTLNSVTVSMAGGITTDFDLPIAGGPAGWDVQYLALEDEVASTYPVEIDDYHGPLTVPDGGMHDILEDESDVGPTTTTDGNILASVYTSNGTNNSYPYQLVAWINSADPLEGPNSSAAAAASGGVTFAYDFTPATTDTNSTFTLGSILPTFSTGYTQSGSRTFGLLVVGSSTDSTSTGTYNLEAGGSLYLLGASINAYGQVLQTGGTLVVAGAYENDGYSSHTGGTASFGSVAGTGVMEFGGGVSVTTGAFHQGTLTISGNASLTSTAATRQTSAVALDIGYLNYTSTSNKFDIANHDLIISGGITEANLRSLLISGRGTSGNWTGASGITSSVANTTGNALGYASAGELSLSTFDGVSVSSSDLLVKYTFPGDANLDGVVNNADMVAFLTHDGATGADWADADFDYNGTVDNADFVAILTHYGDGTGGSFLLVPAIARGPASSVPEPGSLGALAVGTVLLLGRGKRRVRTKT